MVQILGNSWTERAVTANSSIEDAGVCQACCRVELTETADIVTEMRQIKHPHPARNIPPQAGIEF
jgi:hypothetical protein